MTKAHETEECSEANDQKIRGITDLISNRIRAVCKYFIICMPLLVMLGSTKSSYYHILLDITLATPIICVARASSVKFQSALHCLFILFAVFSILVYSIRLSVTTYRCRQFVYMVRGCVPSGLGDQQKAPHFV